MLLQKGVEHSQFRYSRMYRGEADASILLVGNSRGLGFYQPYIEKVTGQETFNFSYNGMTMELASVLIADYLDHYPNPRLLLIDVTMCDRKNPELVTGFAPYSPYSERLQQLILDTDPKSFYAQKVSHLFRYNNEVYQRAIYYSQRSDKDWLLDRTITPSLVKEVEKENYRIDYHLLGELQKTIQLATARGIEVRLLINPYYLPFLEILEGLEEFQIQVEKATNRKVYNFADALESQQYFGDYQHLNQMGSRAYADLLKAEGVFD